MFVHVDQLPAGSSDASCQPLLRFVPEAVVDAVLEWLRRVGHSAFQPLLEDQKRAFQGVIAELNKGNVPQLSENELLQEVHGCWFLHRQRAIELNCVFNDAMFQSKFELEQAAFQKLCNAKDDAEADWEKFAAAKRAVDAALADKKKIEDSGGDSSQLAAAATAMVR